MSGGSSGTGGAGNTLYGYYNRITSGVTLNNYGFYSEGRASGTGSTNSYQFYADFRGVGTSNTNTGVHRGFYADMTPTGELNQVLGDVTGSELAMGVANSSHTITDITGQKIGFNITASSTVTNAIGLNVDMNNASATATNTYAALFNGGNVGIGTASPNAFTELHVAAENAFGTGFLIESAQNSAVAPAFMAMYFHRGTIASPTATLSGDGMATIDFNGYDGASQIAGASINVKATQTHSSVGNLHGSSMSFSTAPNSGGNTQIRMFIEHDGQVGIGTTAPTALLDVTPSTTARSQFRLRSGTAPTTPNDGDIWFDGTNLNIRIAGVTRTVNVT
jgi:hypothetical protein